MPDSKTIIWGALRIEKKQISDASVTPAMTNQVAAISVFDCFPPPGSTAEFVRPGSFSAEPLRQYLQRREMSNLAEAYRQQGGSAGHSNDRILEEISRRLDFVDINIDYTGDKYREMRRYTECFRTTLYLRVEYIVYEVRVVAAQQVTIDGSTFPPGDEIATYRVRQPSRFRFETHHEWNPRCCPERPEKVPESETTSWYERLYSIFDDLEPFRPWRGLTPRLEWRYHEFEEDSGDDERPRLRLRLEYKW